MTNHVSLARLLSTLLQAVCQPLLPGCEFYSCLPDVPSPTPLLLRPLEVRLVRAAS